MSNKSLNAFSAPNTPQTDFLKRPRRQILSVRRKYYTIYTRKVSNKSNNAFSILHLQILIVLSLDADAKYSPFGENVTQVTTKMCPSSVWMRSPLYTFHKPIVLSQDPDAKYSPFGEKTTLCTAEVCPVKDLIQFPLYNLHRLIVLFPDPDAKYSPFGENITLLT